MFESKSRPVNFTQYEHMRLAGTLASHWGNADFDTPALPESSFHAGVALHDLGFGTCDAFSIGTMTATERAFTLERLMSVELEDRVAETVVKHHALRLMDDRDHADIKEECRRRISLLVAHTGIDIEHYRQADTVTEFCDSVAFHFCFELPYRGEVSVFLRNHDARRCPVRFEMDGLGHVRVSPWPFNESSLNGYLIAFERESFPTAHRGVMVPWLVSA